MQKPSENLQVHDFKSLTIEDFEYLCFGMARELMTEREPIPDFSSANIQLLESALGNPLQGTIEGLLYPTINKQVAILFYSLIKNHAFENGNKRIAVMTALVYAAINGKWINVRQDILYNLACQVAESKTQDKDEVLKRIEIKIKLNDINFNEKEKQA